MVSTRGGARTGADEQVETELKLRKKPVRKAATTTKTAKAAPAAKTTRAKKIEPAHEDEDADELQEDEISTAPKVTRRGRAKKDDTKTTTAAAQSKPATTARARATTTTKKAPATRTTKADKPEAFTPDLQPPAQSKPARATRATASTRATAAKERAPPLSPKKITQVSKAPARTNKATNSKPSTGKDGGKAAVKPRAATRRRIVSDENAGVPELRPSTPEKEQTEELDPKQTANGRSAAGKSPAKPVYEPETIEIDNDNDTPMSTRPTTPADSPRLEPDEDHEDVSLQELDDADSDGGEEVEVSADELCGPKTPMKRLSPNERSKFASAQKGRYSEEVPMKTPARRFLVLGSQGGTPQTQKPYCKPSAPLSDVRPTTVARARDRAMVFPKLQPLTLPRALEELDESVDDESHAMSAGDEQAAADEQDVPTEDQSFNDEDSGDIAIHVESVPAEHVNHIVERDNVTIPFQMKDLSIVDVDDTEGDAELAEEDDPDETIVMDDQDMGNIMESQLDASLGSEESVIVRHDMAAEAEESFACDESMEDIRIPTTTPKPETIMWENLREDITIPFNFDSVLSPSRAAALGNLDGPVSSVADELVEAQENSEAMVTDADDSITNEEKMDMTLANPQYQRQSFGDVRLSVDATVNLSDFLDMSSLTEQPFQALPPQAEVDNEDLEVGVLEADEGNDNGALHEMTMPMSPQHLATPVKVPTTPAREILPALPDVPQQEPESMREPDTPHYAMPTIAFRRKSLPAIVYHTPVKNGSRPKTSDGASIARIAKPFAIMPPGQNSSQVDASPVRRRLSTAQAFGSMSRPQTPGVASPARLSSGKTPQTSGRKSVAQTPRTSSRLSVRPTPKERFPGLPCRQTYEELASTPTGKTPRQSMPSAAKSSTKERFPALPPAEKYEDLVKTPASSVKQATPATPQVEQHFTPPVEVGHDLIQQEERYPGLPHRRTYEEHARTAMPTSRFRTPSQSPAKRPATVQRHASLRKVALKASTPTGSRTPIKTPLRAPAMTPGQTLTPHPGAPLRGVNAYVDVFLNDGSSANSTYIAVLHSLGAKTTKTFNDRVTHVVFKEGSPATLQRLRLHNKQVADSAKGKAIFCVNGRWVNDSNSEGARMDESDEAYAVDIEDQRASKRRRKSMEPTSLLNIGGNVVRDTNRKSSLGRSSLGRALKADSPSMDSPSMPMSIDVVEKENSVDISFGEDSPDTPAYLADPDSLVQQTAPMNRVRKLDFDAQEQAKNRRLTFWDGGEF